VRNERLGPGLLSYPDGRSDMGIWQRDQLVRLCSRVAWTPGFSVVDYGYQELCHQRKQPTDGSTRLSESLLSHEEQLQQLFESWPMIRRRVDQVFSIDL